ncbi:WD40 domain-containing protein/Rav1p_C domain-containing protein [Cephalotus follicularis]|uniref:WD40 domain-containing protein/Rav1p_C domain-containing protein n=1 Tax=Cephalotus follicularis TaxID=3775 RepID=A0A1Q3BTD7_CEPFO|nr:WD40 domain-containing protein/Rav1p_C domain-containing protein [Cephalotus follicularis]
MHDTSSNSQDAITAVDPTSHLPLQFFRSETIPPAPTRSTSTIDWLPDFAGYSWIAYGASSLLVISHFPSPLSRQETLIGPVLRQVLELSSDASGSVAAVSWSPVTPSIGELAAASENCICVFSHDSSTSKGSFCWSQNAVLVQSTNVEAIEWTGSGDGIISGGIEVVLWKRRNRSWQIAWKCKRDHPQNLVSSTWSILGPAATAAYQCHLHGETSNTLSKCVLVCHSDKTSQYVKAELRHPQPVSMIQWRPSAGKQSRGVTRHSTRYVLLTCCLDGTVRLWSEIDNARVRRSNDHKTMRRSFCVAAVIEMNQVCKGTLGTDVFISWATEIWGIYKTCEEGNQVLTQERYEHDKAGHCEWLIGFGPGALVTFWAIHCLDDISPIRFPRVTLWKRHELQHLEVGHLYRTGFPNFKDQIILNKVVVSRNCLSGPPTVCSLIHLSHFNSLAWSFLYTETSSNIEDGSLSKLSTDNLLTCSARGVLNSNGHTGKILQVAVHPYICEVELAVSLDSYGLLLFWSLSTISNCTSSFPPLIPTWKLCGKLITQDSCSKYTSLGWAPSVLGEDRVLLMGHVGGIDCFIVKISQSEEENILCHYICTVPFTGHGPYEEGPTKIFAIPFSSTCTKTFEYNKFLLLGLWTKGFQALSWEITLHSYDLSGSCCECNFDDESTAKHSLWKFENTFAGKRYCLVVYPCSSKLPEPHNHDQVTSFAVVCPGGLTPIEHKLAFNNDLCSHDPAYVMATGCSDGSLKLWRSTFAGRSNPHATWELVGMFLAHQGPISTICLTDCGGKIATACVECHSNSVSTVCIWASVHLAGVGSFMLEDSLSLDKDVVDLKWLAVGNGQSLLGVCLKNELQVYAQRRCSGLTFVNTEKSLTTHLWFCIAFAHTFSPIHDFLWGPRATAVVVHESYFSLFSQWLFLVNKKRVAESFTSFIKGSVLDCDSKIDKVNLSSIFTDCKIDDFKESSIEDGVGDSKSVLPLMFDLKNDHLSSSYYVARTHLECSPGIILGVWSLLEIADELRESLPVYHPEALLVNIISGNWKRAYVSVRYLVKYLTSDYASKMTHSFGTPRHIVPQILLSNYLEGLLSYSSTDKGLEGSRDATYTTSHFQGGLFQFGLNSESDASNNIFSSSSTKSELCGFVEPLENLYELAGISNIEKTHILAMIDLLSEVSNKQSASAYENLDVPGQRFWLTLRFQQLHIFQRLGRSASVEELVVDSRLMGWAFHSDCQETLVNSFVTNESSWQEMQTLGIGYWFTNVTQLRTRIERLARIQYLKKKDPKDCALLYIALNRLQVLAGLFKISKAEKDKPLVAFLSRNFQEEKNKSAALKNAYVLMGRHQLELAIAFFLLGGDFSSAVTVCVKNLGDEQLALVICRLVEGHGGPLEYHLITKFILPTAVEKGDRWLASILEWELGNYSQSYLSMLDFHMDSVIKNSALSSSLIAFVDPSVGLYCLTLANKNCMRNCVGEQNAALLGRWATLMAAAAYNRCGLPIEALECLSSSVSILGPTDQDSIADGGHSQIPCGILKPSAGDSSNWLSGDVSFHLDSHAKLDLALQYLSKLLKEHPSWPTFEGITCYKDYEINQCKTSFEDFQHKFYSGLTQFKQKFSIVSCNLMSMIMVFLRNNGLLFVGYEILNGYTSRGCSQDESGTVGVPLYPYLHKPLLKAIEDISFLFPRFIAVCSINSPQRISQYKNAVPCEVISKRLDDWRYYFYGVILSVWSLKDVMGNFSGAFTKDPIMKPLIILDLYEYCLHFASAWLHRNSQGLFLMVEPLLITFTNGHTPYEIDIMNLKKILRQIAELCAHKTEVNDKEVILKVTKSVQDREGGNTMQSIPEDERWKIIGACLWHHIFKFVKHKLSLMSINLDDNYFSDVSLDKIFWEASSPVFQSSNSITEQIRLSSLILAKLLNSTLGHISSYHVKQLALLLQQKMESGLHVPTLVWLEESSLSRARTFHQNQDQGFSSLDIMNNRYESSFSEILWNICADPNIINECFEQEKINWSHYLKRKKPKGWSDMDEGIMQGGIEESCNLAYENSGIPACGEGELPARALFRNKHFLSSWQKDVTITKDFTHFQKPKEIYKINGELLEAICVNSVYQRQAALACNRKGIVFFSWDDGIPFREKSDYIWSDADWPHNGWAASVSTSVPACISPCVGLVLGSKKGEHLGLGGASIGVGSSARPGRDLTGGGAFGVPGYAGIGASGLGWEIQEDFKEFIDPPATTENISTRAFSSHPSRPFFLVGSSNTHIYLWEFGKDKATATYGVLPAANIPPPYAVASILSLQFDPCGHRFASAALDGTVCTWQLEVGGRSNVFPTETSLCFNSHASDVTYVTSSGSVIAAAGHSSNDANVVMWDTLAPPTTSRASIICHEGGARSISVFDNNMGSGSVSPLIVSGGKGGDIGIHDFRYIATGRTKRYRRFGNGEPSISTSNTDTQAGIASKSGDQNVNGMLWYIPKAHLGSITKISTIPNTSLFLTGSKDGDVKLWDAKAAKLVHHWSKLHERHTFLLPSSRGFGGVARAAVTDIQVFSHGFLTCGGDGSVKLVQLKDHHDL